MLNQAEASLLDAAIRINMIIMAVALGLLGGGLLFFSTVILLLRGGYNVGMHLSLLAVFFPGYSVSWTGAWIGLAWGLACGAISGVVLYWSYARTLKERLGSQVVDTPATASIVPPIFLLSGNALGVGLGSLMALQLFLTTNWLVVRGTAAYSTNAALVGQYLPGYSVSFRGSLVGAAELFAVMFVISHIVAGVYNAVTSKRLERDRANR